MARNKRKINQREKMKNTMYKHGIYLISTDDKGTPFLADNKYLLLYFEEKKAYESVKELSNIYGNGNIYVFKLENNALFYEKMWNCGITEFIADGESRIYDMKEFLDLPKKNRGASYSQEIIESQPSKKETTQEIKIVIKYWFSLFVTVCVICGISAMVTYILQTILEVKLNGLINVLACIGVASGIVARLGAHAEKVECKGNIRTQCEI